MRGKIVNLCLAFVNLLAGALVLIYTLKVPEDITALTVQENLVVSKLTLATYIVLGIISFIDLIQSFNHKSDSVFNTGYIIGIFCISFIFIKQPLICIFSVVCGLIVLFKSMVENLVEIDSTIAIYISIIVMAAIAILIGLCFGYPMIGQNIKNKENKSETPYDERYFEYVTELDISDVYINYKKDGKYGYINQNGDEMIQALYDYASPFVKINVYGKTFYIALVCQDGRSIIIMKNGRIVMSYKSESNDLNYDAKIKELEDLYKNTFKQEGEMEFEIPYINNNIARVSAYDEDSIDYTYRYDYNEEYDLIVTTSNVGLGDSYELAEKNNINIKIPLESSSNTKLDYDKDNLYLFSNGTIPYYEISKSTSGWYTKVGKKIQMTGKAQILDFFGDDILLRDYTKDSDKIYFINNQANKVSDVYKDIYVCPNGRFIVKDTNDDMKIINNDYTDAFDRKFAIINPRLTAIGLYIVLESTDAIKYNQYGYAEFNWALMNDNGEFLMDNIQELYDLNFRVQNNNKEEEHLKFIDSLKQLDYRFVGDKFYKD